MLLDYLIVVPYVVPFQFHDFVDQGLGDTGAEIIILSLLIQRNGHKILMDSNHEFLKIDFFDQFVHILRKLKQTFDNQTWNFRLVCAILVLGQQAEEHYENVGVIAVFEHSEHGGVQVLEDELAFFV